ncbi:UNVERIFIED_CONTAM: Ribosomal RNA small subunit methyltransferase NEP1 [Sesamum radiatum]|uniref:Ribosomal RNA small subunit methyltransferase NEP1 n=1 Tax=Sesamum radiatum TaxID=300843 RepID=A0AAW2ND95_SESRA
MREDLEISETDKKGDMEFTEDKLNDDICPDDAPEVKRLNADVFGGVEVGKEGTWSSSKDIVARDNERRKTCNTQAKKSRRGNCSGSKNALPQFQYLSCVYMSRLNLTGGIQAVYVKTIQGHLIKIEPTLSVPRTLKRFCSMMSEFLHQIAVLFLSILGLCFLLLIFVVPFYECLIAQLFQNLRIKASGLSSTSPKAVNLWEYFDTIGSAHPLVFVIGAMAHGKIDSDYTDDFIADLFSIVFLSGMPVLDGPSSCNTLDRIPAAV